MHQRISKKIIIYFLLFILIGSVNNISLINQNFAKVLEINISGLNQSEVLSIKNDLNNLYLKNIFSLDKNEISNVINSYNLIENFNIFKKYPSTINIEIDETNFLAKINHNSKIFIVGSNGKLLDNENYKDYLPFIFGKPEIIEFLKFKKIIDQSKYSYQQIKNLYFYPSKRWDIEFKNGKIIKLSNLNIIASLNQSYEFFNHESFKDIKIIDARIKNKIIIK